MLADASYIVAIVRSSNSAEPSAAASWAASAQEKGGRVLPLMGRGAKRPSAPSRRVLGSRDRCFATYAWRRSHHGQKPAGAKALVSSSISRRSSRGGFETVRIPLLVRMRSRAQGAQFHQRGGGRKKRVADRCS